MPFDPFHVDLDGVLGLSQVHADAAETLTGAKESALAKAAGVDATHGSIGTRVAGAFSEVLDARHGALHAAAHTSSELSQRLAKAVSAYSRGDERGAESVRAAAESMTGGVAASPSPPLTAESALVGASTTPGSLGGHAPSGTVGAAESSGIGDALGHFGPHGDRLAESAGQPLPQRDDAPSQPAEHFDVPDHSTGVGATAAESDDLDAAGPAVATSPGRPADDDAERLTQE